MSPLMSLLMSLQCRHRIRIIRHRAILRTLNLSMANREFEMFIRPEACLACLETLVT